MRPSRSTRGRTGRKAGARSGSRRSRPGRERPRGGCPASRVGDHRASPLVLEKMAVFLVTDVVLLVLLPLIVRLTSGARLRDFGLSFEGWWRQAAVGVVAALIAAPLVYSVQFLATRIWE